MSNNLETKARQLAELGHVTRLEVYQFLVTAGKTGFPVSAIQEQLGIPASTLSHHLSRLVRVGLVIQTREGRVLRCCANIPELKSLADYLLSECCTSC